MDTIRNDIGCMLNELGRPITIIFTVSTFSGRDIFSDKIEKQFEFEYSDGEKPNGFRYNRRKDYDSADRRRDWLLSEIYFAIFTRGHDLLFEIIDEETTKVGSTNLKIRAFLKSFMTFKKKYPDYFAALFYFSTNRVSKRIV